MKYPMIRLSHSSADRFFTCPYAYEREKLIKDVPYLETEATSWGSRVHSSIESYIKGEQVDFATLMMTDVEPVITWLREFPADHKAVEQEWAFNTKGEICAFNDPDAMFGGYTDFESVTGSNGFVCDFKGLPLTTELATPNGFTTMGEISVGDEIYGSDGNIYNVTGKSKVKNLRCFKIRFDDTVEVVCDEEHLWPLTDGSVKCVLDLSIGDKMPIAKPVAGKYRELPIDPYVLGFWLADGKHSSGETTKPDDFMWDEVVRRGYEIGNNLGKNGKCRAHTIKGIRGKLSELGVLSNKHIPEIYMHASFEQRLDLLRGLMDGDGSANHTRKQAVFITTDKRLSDQVKELASSLGQRVNQGTTKQTGFGLTVTAYPLHFKPQHDLIPFMLPRKADKCKGWGRGESWYRKVVSIEQVESVSTQCISVNSPDNTYLITRDYVVTHNTGKRHSKYEQVELYALSLWLRFPQINEVRAGYMWLKERDPNTFLSFKTLYRATDLERIWKYRFDQYTRIKAAHDTGVFPATPGKGKSKFPCGWCSANHKTAGCDYSNVEYIAK